MSFRAVLGYFLEHLCGPGIPFCPVETYLGFENLGFLLSVAYLETTSSKELITHLSVLDFAEEVFI